MLEEWRPIEGEFAGGGYEVSNMGRVASLKFGKYRILRDANVEGYRFVHLCANGKKQVIRLHRLVAMAFIPIDRHRPIINHKNSVKHMNWVSNLEWVTHHENVHHAINAGRMPHLQKPKADKERCLVFTLGEVRAIRDLRRRGVSGRFLARWFGVSEALISRVYRGNRYDFASAKSLRRLRRSTERRIRGRQNGFANARSGATI